MTDDSNAESVPEKALFTGCSAEEYQEIVQMALSMHGETLLDDMIAQAKEQFKESSPIGKCHWLATCLRLFGQQFFVPTYMGDQVRAVEGLPPRGNILAFVAWLQGDQLKDIKDPPALYISKVTGLDLDDAELLMYGSHHNANVYDYLTATFVATGIGLRLLRDTHHPGRDLEMTMAEKGVRIRLLANASHIIVEQLEEVEAVSGKAPTAEALRKPSLFERFKKKKKKKKVPQTQFDSVSPITPNGASEMKDIESRTEQVFADHDRYIDYCLGDVGFVSAFNGKFGFISCNSADPKEKVFFDQAKVRRVIRKDGLLGWVPCNLPRTSALPVSFDWYHHAKGPRARTVVLYEPDRFEKLLNESASSCKYRLVFRNKRVDQEVLWIGRDLIQLQTKFPLHEHPTFDRGVESLQIEEWVTPLEAWMRVKTDPRQLLMGSLRGCK